MLSKEITAVLTGITAVPEKVAISFNSSKEITAVLTKSIIPGDNWLHRFNSSKEITAVLTLITLAVLFTGF